MSPASEKEASRSGATSTPCLVCGGESDYHTSIPFLKSCEGDGEGDPVAYFLCADCGFCHAPFICDKPPEWFRENIYNADYKLFDPEYGGVRAQRQAQNMTYSYSWARRDIRHLDFGGGDGLMAERTRKKGFDSTSYDPFTSDEKPTGTFNLITCFEVFEHVPGPNELMRQLTEYLAPEGLILASTNLSDGQDISRWWYAAPRNGHISLFSRKSLAILAEKHGLNSLIDVNGGHYFYRELPYWAVG